MTQSPIFGVVPTGSGAQVRADFNTAHVCESTEHSGTSAPTPAYPYMYWRHSSTGALYQRNAGNSGWEIVDWFSTVDPAVGDDTADGFVRGSKWINITGNKVFFCVNPAAGAASWSQVGAGAAGGAVTTVFGRGGAVVAASGDYNAGQVTETAGAKIMTSAERTKLGNVNAYWASRTVTDPAMIVKNVTIGAHDLRQFTVYHGVPNAINAVNNADYAAGQIARFDDVVLGYGLQATGDANYATTVSVISKAKVINPRLTVWGNIDVGVSGGTSHNHSTGTLQTHIDQWVNAGANGIFCDNFGFDRGVTRARQNIITNYVHGKGIGAMLYSTAIADALSPAVVATYNATGVATAADSRDAFMSVWAFNSDSVIAPYFNSFSAMKTRGDDMRTYRTSTGVRMYAINVQPFTGTGLTELSDYRGIAESLAHIFRLDGSGVALTAFSGAGADLNKMLPYPPKVAMLPGGRLTALYRVNGASTEIDAPDLGVVVHYESGQYTYDAPGKQTTSSGGGGTVGDSGLIPTSIQSSNGNAQNAERVRIEGAVSEVYLLTISTGRHSTVFKNATINSILITSSETITGYSTGFGLPAGESVNFVRNPSNNQWEIW